MPHNNLPRERGTAWERRVADFFAGKGLPWDRSPLRGRKDLGDISGSIPMGWLLDCKGRGPGKPVRLNEEMIALAAAVKRVPKSVKRKVTGALCVQRPGHPIGDAYVVMRMEDFADLVIERWAAENGAERAS